MDNAWEQEKLEARKMLVNRADSHTSGARFVGRRFLEQFYYRFFSLPFALGAKTKREPFHFVSSIAIS
ncbi:MAG: hypothetical protein WAV79_10840, partial [Anaerolineae bacterium]